MTVPELVSRFPEIPADLHDLPVLAEFAETFDAYLKTAVKPSACADDWTDENRAYMTLVGPMDIYRYGLSTREKVVGQVGALLDTYRTSVEAFESQMHKAA